VVTHGARRRLRITPVKTNNRRPIAAPFLEAGIVEDAALPSARPTPVGPPHGLSAYLILVSITRPLIAIWLTLPQPQTVRINEVNRIIAYVRITV
jgi:hypothetical protein